MRQDILYGLILSIISNSLAMALEPYQMPAVVVVGVTPMMGSGVDMDKMPSNVQVLNVVDGPVGASETAADLLNARLGSISAADYSGNALQPSLSFRGFTASPTLGEPQGLAVYQNGMRLNEAFGDMVNWDMNPSFAVDQIQVLPGSNPVFGLNALGGAVALKMKDGFSNPGTTAEISGGSFGRIRLTAETGQKFSGFGFYSGLSVQSDDGWRRLSPSKLLQSYTDLAIRKDNLDLGVGVTLAASSLAGLASSPVQLLQQDRTAIMTGPDLTQNALAAVDLRGNYQPSDSISLQGNIYVRHLRSRTPNGNASGASACVGNPNQLCDGDGTVMTDRTNTPLSSQLASTGIINTTLTNSDGMGASAQVSDDRNLVGLHNAAVVGASTDRGWTDYLDSSELGTLSLARQVTGDGIFLGGPAYNVGLNAQNIYYGLYFTDTLSLTDKLHLTGAGRFNRADVTLRDQLGTGLDGAHRYQRFNPSLGVSWQVMKGLTSFVNYAEASRVPTPAEMSCADPALPCRVPNAFASDPNLQQVVSHTIEVGGRGKIGLGETDKAEWSLSAYDSRNANDIIFISSGSVIGTGYFSNVGATERQGLEANLDIALGRWSWHASYGLVRASFESNLAIQSPFNSAADSSGNIFVHPGDRMPGIPLHSLKLGGAYSLSDFWSVAGEAKLSSGRHLRGDESNSMPQIPGYGVLNLSSIYKLHPNAEAILRIQNVLDQHYATAGALGDPTLLFPRYTDTRFETPGEPRSFWIGLRFMF